MNDRFDGSAQPPCYGFNYLTAIDALMAAEAGGHPVPDPMELRDMLADVQDMRLSTLLAGIVDTCADKDGKEEEDGAAKSELVCGRRVQKNFKKWWWCFFFLNVVVSPCLFSCSVFFFLKAVPS